MEYRRLSAMPETGIHFREHFRFCVDHDESAYARHLVDEWEAIDPAGSSISCRQAFRVVLPVIDVPVFMPYLKTEIQSIGAALHLRHLDSPQQLFPEFDLVVNCSGVHARSFVADEAVFPVRGQVVRVSLPAGLRHSTRLYQQDDRFTLVLPRSDDVILGGTSQSGDWDREPRAKDTITIVERCAELVPQIADCKILGSAVGLRPARKAVRLELEMIKGSQPVIHNYGHGGSGFTVAWGCADEVLQLTNNYFADS
ncbi:MAG: FAD-binding oxidoreductase [Gammaproteobacteria bacterium]|nr:FAD-binding oxidoreductase [Gammaproteobacteria bacterium]